MDARDMRAKQGRKGRAKTNGRVDVGRRLRTFSAIKCVKLCNLLLNECKAAVRMQSDEHRRLDSERM